MAHKKLKIVKRKGKPPLIKSPVGPSKRKPTPQKLKRKPKFAEKTHAEITRKKETHKREGDPSPPHTSVGRLSSQRIKDRIAEAARKLPLSKKKHGGSTEAKRARYMKGGPVRTKREAKKGGTVSKRYGGMSHVGLSPAEEARTGTLSEAARRRPRMPTPRLPVRPTPRMPTPRMPMPQRVRRRPMNKGGTVYRKLNGQVTNGNHVVSKGYRGST